LTPFNGRSPENTKSNYSWRPIVNRTVVDILLHKNIEWNKKNEKKREKKLTDGEQDREQQEA